jgi:hypothetical protein
MTASSLPPEPLPSVRRRPLFSLKRDPRKGPGPSDAAVRRMRRAAFLALLALVVLGAVAATAITRAVAAAPPKGAGLALPAFAGRAAETTAIRITTKDQAYTILKTGRGWVIREKGDYPVRQERLAAFTEGFSTLQKTRAVTRDRDKFDRIGLGDPRSGGTGALVEITGDRGAIIGRLIAGVGPGGVYVREPEASQAWAATGTMPPLQDASAWLDLQPLSLGPERIASVELIPQRGPAYLIARPDPQTPFALVRPFAGVPVISQQAVDGPATAATRFRPIDVRPIASLAVPRVSFHRTRTFDGLVVDVAGFEEGGRIWLTVRAEASAPERQPEADAINAAASPWAFGFTRYDWADYAAPIDTVINRPLAAPSSPVRRRGRR